jgi:hypothetical protein
MFKSLFGVLVCSWAWHKWQERETGFTVEYQDASNTAKKSGSLPPKPALTRDFPYMELSNISRNSIWIR